MNKDWCRYYTGLIDKKCSKGISYSQFNQGREFGLFKIVPCLRKNENDACSDCEFPSEEEVKAVDEKIEQHFQAMKKALSIIQVKHSVKPEWENPTNRNEGAQGTIECPLCKGTLHYTISGYNGHIWGQCKTKDCLSWMM